MKRSKAGRWCDVRIHGVGSELPASELSGHPDDSSSQENCNEEAGRAEISNRRHRDKSQQMPRVYCQGKKAFSIHNGERKISFKGRFTHWNPRPEPARWPTSPTLSSPCSPVRSCTQLPATTFDLSDFYEEANLYKRGLWRQVRGRGGPWRHFRRAQDGGR